MCVREICLDVPVRLLEASDYKEVTMIRLASPSTTREQNFRITKEKALSLTPTKAQVLKPEVKQSDMLYFIQTKYTLLVCYFIKIN
jgi:hypothetical protein